MKLRAYVRIRPDGVEDDVKADEAPLDVDELYEEVMALARAPLPPDVEEAA